MPEILRVAFLGAGSYAQRLARKVLAVPDTQLVGVTDVSVASAQVLAEQHGSCACADYRDLLARDPDVLFVCIPPYAHTGQEIEAAQRGVHLFVSKPVALDMDYAHRVNRAIRDSGVLSCVSYMLRYSEPVNRAKEMLVGRQIGLVRGHVLARMVGGPRRWYYRKEQSGGQLVVQSGHLIDIFRYLVGEIAQIYAAGSTSIMQQSSEYDIEDASVAVMRFCCGAVGSLCSTVAMPPNCKEDMAFDIVAEDLHLTYALHEGILHAKDETGCRDFGCGVSNDGVQEAEVQAFLAAIRSQSPSLIHSSYDDAVKTLEVSLIANRSMQLGRPLTVPYGE